MKKTIVTKTILILSVICFILQFAPTNSYPYDTIQNHLNDSNSFIKSVSVYDHAYLSGRFNKKISFYNFLLKSPSINIYKTSFENRSPSYSLLNQKPFDIRTDIRRAIPNYFNGSKYKNENSYI
jgi:uncharacterized protein YozE (UPF0346 family)